MFIRDNENGNVRLYGTNHHDSLRVSPDGKRLYYENLQNGDGSEGGGYSFVTDEGVVPKEDSVLSRHGADAYFNIGGFADADAAFADGYEKAKADILRTIEEKKACMIEHGVEPYKIDGLDALKAIVQHTNLPHSGTENGKG